MPDPRLRFPDRQRALFAPKFTKVNPPPPARPEDLTTAHDRAPDAAFRSEVAKVRTAKPGTRNYQLFRSTAALAQISAFGCLDIDHVRAAMMAASGENGSIDEDGALRCQKTIESAIRTGSQCPRDPASRATARLKRGR
jgi:hypothetical protein